MAYLLLVCTLPFQVLDNISSRAQVFHSDKVHLTNLIVSVFLSYLQGPEHVQLFFFFFTYIFIVVDLTIRSISL